MPLGSEDLNQLVALGALLEERHVTRAGDRLGVSQSAMSGTLRRLRIRFEDPLLIRSGQVLVPTALGEALLPLAQQALFAAEKVFARVSDFEPSLSERRFRIALSDYAQLLLAPELCRRVASVAQGVRIDFEALPADIAHDTDRWLLQYDFVILPREFVRNRVKATEALFEDHFVCVLADDSAAIVDGVLDIEVLSKLPLLNSVAYTGIDSTMALGKAARAAIGPGPRVAATASYAAASYALRGSTMWSALPRKFAELTSGSSLAIHEFPWAGPSFTEHLHWHPGRDEDNGTQWMRQNIRESASSLTSAL